MYGSSTNAGSNPAGLVAGLIIGIIAIVAMWKVFTKAGKPGWASIIPFYNTYTLLKVVGRSGWWLILFFIPIVNIVIAIIVAQDLAKSFGRSGVFGFFGLFLFSIIGYLMLAFGDSQYIGPGGQSTATPAPAV